MLDPTPHRTDSLVAPPTPGRRHDLLAGARAMLPWLTGIVPSGW